MAKPDASTRMRAGVFSGSRDRRLDRREPARTGLPRRRTGQILPVLTAGGVNAASTSGGYA
jgi:hypothetical protein